MENEIAVTISNLQTQYVTLIGLHYPSLVCFAYSDGAGKQNRPPSWSVMFLALRWSSVDGLVSSLVLQGLIEVRVLDSPRRFVPGFQLPCWYHTCCICLQLGEDFLLWNPAFQTTCRGSSFSCTPAVHRDNCCTFKMLRGVFLHTIRLDCEIFCMFCLIIVLFFCVASSITPSLAPYLFNRIPY